MSSTSNFRFSPTILVRLGEELVPNLDQAIIELVRNAYDADASVCRIDILDAKKPGGTIELADDGSGMRESDIVNGWLVLGGSSKTSQKLTPLKNRHTVGDKGLGRLAALRAGSHAELLTRHISCEESSAFSVSLDWNDFESAKLVEDVALSIVPAWRKEPGTTVRLIDLKKGLSKAEVDRLGRAIVLLTSPFGGEQEFRVELSSPDYPELESRVRNGYLQDAEFVLKATIRADGTAFAQVVDWKGAVIYSAESTEWIGKQAPGDAIYHAPETTFELYNFVFNKNVFAGRGSTMTEVKQWLKVVGGVHFYHRQFRVPPYGDQGFDWLDMNLARARSPEERPSTNNSVGRVIVNDPTGRLRQKTDRVGFIEELDFLEIRRFAKNALDWFARRRLRDAEARRDVQREEANRAPAQAKADLLSMIEKSVPKDQLSLARDAIGRLEQKYEKAIRATREDLVLYRSLATAGTTAAVFAHEIGKPIQIINSNQKSIRRRIADLKPKKKVEEAKPPLDLILRATERLSRFAGMQIDFLRRDKRRHGVVDVNRVLADLHALWKPVLEDAKITLVLEPHDVDGAAIFGAEALVETIVTNCLTNSVGAFQEPGARTKGRIINLRAIAEGETVAIEVEDNGPGISMDLEEIWLPGRTTKSEGTGFGLTITKDSSLDLGGKYSASTVPGVGAKFRFVFPLIMTEG